MVARNGVTNFGLKEGSACQLSWSKTCFREIEMYFNLKMLQYHI